MKKRFTSALVLVAGLACVLLITACCPISLYPLSDPQNATYDKRLEGSWRGRSDDGATGFLHISRMEGHLTQVIFIENKEDGALKCSVLAMFPTAIDDVQYMNIIFDEVSTGIPKDIKGYVFAKYEFTENNNYLLFSIMEMRTVARAIKSNRLKGTLKYKIPVPAIENHKKPADSESLDSIQCVTIKDTPENMIKFIKTTDPKELFTNPVKLERQDGDTVMGTPLSN